MTALGRLVLFCLRHVREPGRSAQEIARWLGLPADARIQSADAAQLDVWADRVLTAATLDEVLADA